jgi:hypothetical protein
MTTEQIKELVLRKHNMNGGFTEGEAKLVIDWIQKTSRTATTVEESLFEKIESLFPELWNEAMRWRKR